MTTVYDQIVAAYPELASDSTPFRDGTIVLQDDGGGPYIRVWSYSRPLPDGLSVVAPIVQSPVNTPDAAPVPMPDPAPTLSDLQAQLAALTAQIQAFVGGSNG